MKPVPPFYWLEGEGDQPSAVDLPEDGVVLGHDLGTFIVESADGSVYSVAESRGLRRFVNSSVAQFRAALDLFAAAYNALAEVAESDVAARMRVVRADLVGVDEVAMQNVDNWWPLVIEQAEHGVL